MRTLRITLAWIALIIANAAYADRVFNLEGHVTVKVLGESFTDNVSGSLTLVDDGTYALDLEGEISSGIWLEEKEIQLFQEAPSVSESIADLEQEISDAAGLPVRGTSIVGKEKIMLAKSGDISMRTNTSFTIRPGPTARKPLKVKESIQLIGFLQ